MDSGEEWRVERRGEDSGEAWIVDRDSGEG